jgi:hypothetical protein
MTCFSQYGKVLISNEDHSEVVFSRFILYDVPNKSDFEDKDTYLGWSG